MNQYERIVSYIYQYQHGEKGANVGFARVEKRGNICRIAVQMRSVPLSRTPQVYLFRQLEEGIETVYVGQMIARGSDLLCKASSDAEKLFHTYEKIDDMEGIFIDVEDHMYFATSWKNDTFYLGNWKKSSSKESAAPDTKAAAVTEESTERKEQPLEGEEKEAQENEQQPQENEQLEGTSKDTAQMQEQTLMETEQSVQIQEEIAESIEQPRLQAQSLREEQSVEEQEGTPAEKDEVQMQSICGVCPFKRRTYDYGKKILMTFPSMKPFEPGVAKACVRMELQDIGCLPIASWSLSGNRFLLHGYYCYRHLIFAQLADGKYVLGVPGIYSDKEKSNAIRFGFSKFQSIGDFGQKQGAFGYWMLGLPEGKSL